MTPEQKARLSIDKKLEQSGWTVQDLKQLNPMASLGIAVREFPTNTGPVDYALFVNGKPVGVIEAKPSNAGENITTVEEQSARYANSTFKWIKTEYSIRFAYEATDKLIRFTDYNQVPFPYSLFISQTRNLGVIACKSGYDPEQYEAFSSA